ncbi:P-loop NTPase [Acidaminobacterium chupaoyuni]
MSETCSHNCETCGEACASRSSAQNMTEKPHPGSHVKKVIGVVSGKGGVGKSLVTSLLAVEMQRRGHKTAILDADITGPSIPKAFGIHEKARGNGDGILPAVTKNGTEVMSINLLLENETDPVVWRGPVIATTVKQFWSDVIWNDVDYMFVDMPPGTGDVPLTVFQSLPVDAIIVVTSPQELVSMIVGKALKMAQLMNIPVLGVVENMSYVECPDCGKKILLYGESKTAQAAADEGLPLLAQMPIDPAVAALCDAGKIEEVQVNWMDRAVESLEKIEEFLWDKTEELEYNE